MAQLLNVEESARISRESLSYQFPPFPTILTGIPNKIITFSDIHGDLDALLVCLRDCAKVIVKPGYDPNLERDRDLDVLLHLDINDPRYVRSLGYEWVDDIDTIVVIIGDLIDPVRYRGINAGEN